MIQSGKSRGQHVPVLHKRLRLRSHLGRHGTRLGFCVISLMTLATLPCSTKEPEDDEFLARNGSFLEAFEMELEDHDLLSGHSQPRARY